WRVRIGAGGEIDRNDSRGGTGGTGADSRGRDDYMAGTWIAQAGETGMSTTIGFLGLGAMGAPMAANLVAAGFRVQAWNRSRAKADAVAGARACGTPREAATGADFVLTMLADDDAVEQVTHGPDGLLSTLGPEAVHVGMSTVSVAVTRRLIA